MPEIFAAVLAGAWLIYSIGLHRLGRLDLVAGRLDDGRRLDPVAAHLDEQGGRHLLAQALVLHVVDLLPAPLQAGGHLVGRVSARCLVVADPHCRSRQRLHLLGCCSGGLAHGGDPVGHVGAGPVLRIDGEDAHLAVLALPLLDPQPCGHTVLILTGLEHHGAARDGGVHVLARPHEAHLYLVACGVLYEDGLHVFAEALLVRCRILGGSACGDAPLEVLDVGFVRALSDLFNCHLYLVGEARTARPRTARASCVS